MPAPTQTKAQAAPETVRLPRAALAPLRAWPEILDRTRHHPNGRRFFPVALAPDIQRVRDALHDAAEVADRVEAPEAAVPEWAWALLQTWRPLLTRAKSAGVPLTPNELAALAAGERVLEGRR